MRFWKIAGILTICGVVFGQSPESAPPAVKHQIVELKGKIARIELTPDRDLPFMEVKSDSGNAVRVQLTSLRYLMEQDFNPKVDQLVTVRGFMEGGQLVAISVNLPAKKKLYRLRDDAGHPAWLGGRQKQSGG